MQLSYSIRIYLDVITLLTWCAFRSPARSGLIESPPGGCTAAPSFVLGGVWQAFVDRLDLGEISAHLARHREVGKWGITTTVPAARIVQTWSYKRGTKVRRVKSFTSLGLLLASFWDLAGVQNYSKWSPGHIFRAPVRAFFPIWGVLAPKNPLDGIL